MFLCLFALHGTVCVRVVCGLLDLLSNVDVER